MNPAQAASGRAEANAGAPRGPGPTTMSDWDPALLLAIELATFGESLRALPRPEPARSWLDASRRRVLARFDARVAD